MVLPEKVFYNELMEVTCKVNDKKLKTVVDTGSTKSCINDKLALELNLNIHNVEKQFNLFSINNDKINI